MSEFVFQYHAALLEQAKIKRQLAAEQIKRMRLLEQIEPDYLKDSTLRDYLQAAKGLEVFLKYARSQAPLVLEIGSGTTTAIGQMAESQLGEGLDFIGTTLTRRPGVKPLPNLTLRETAVEVLRGIPQRSIGGILSLGAIAFSRAPELVVANIDNTLVKGGVLKATFRGSQSYGPEWDAKYDDWAYGSHEPFSAALLDHRYDVTILRTEADDVLVAVKPGNKHAPRSQELIGQDLSTLPQQLALAA